MSTYNYVVTAHKPTNVTHSCVGNFTGPQELNLIIAKCTRIEIHLLTPQGLQPMLDVPIYGRIATLELFRSHVSNCLVVSIERTNDIFCRAMGDVSDRIGRPTDNGQIGIIDPDCRLIGLHLYDGLFKVIPFDNKGQLKEAFNIRLEELQVLDIKFLYGCPKPTIVVLYQDNKDARHVKTYEVSLKDKDFVEGPWSQNNLDNGADLLIPVPPPFCGVLIIGEETISITRAYGRVDADGSRYLLGDLSGLLHLLVIVHEKDKVTGLKIELLGETSIASTISYLDNAFVYVGSSFGDSQLIKLNLQPDTKGSYVEVLERYVNLGPIVDFCVVDLERQGQGQVVTCSGAYKDGSICIVRNGIGINEQASVELQGIKGMWSLRSATDDIYDTFLVVSFISETRILAMNVEDELEETEIEGFCSQVQTLFCHDAVHNQLVQVTSSSVRLVSSVSRELRHEWHAPTENSINVATANATQLVCGRILVIFSLPDLELRTEQHLGGEIIPRSVLLCAFEGIPYLLCALGDGHLLNFLLNTGTGELTDRKKVSLGTQPITLRTFSSKNTTHVFAASDRPTVIYSSNKKLLYSNVNLKEVSHMCPFNSAAFPDSLAIAKEDDNNAYYCVGTAYVMPEENEPTKGRILVFMVEDGKLQLVAEKETKGAVYSLNAFNGKLLAAINQKIQLYKWMLRDDGTRELQSECGHHGHILALYVQTRGDFIVVGDLMKSISLLIYKHEEGAIEERARDYNANWMSAVEILDDDIYLGAENNFNLFTVRKNSEGATDEERGRLEVVGEYHLGEFVNRFRHGSLVMRLPDSDVGQIPTIIFGTVNGVIGVIASLPQDQYIFMEKLQSNLRKVIKGVGGLSHEQWRSFYNEKKTSDSRNFLDGDLIESFLDLGRSRMEEISKSMNVSVEEVMKRVEELTRLH
ncbi:LOW QUALITY PROTEIN: hypothetical protein M8C21_020503 [Ambrosia artemisiifolia]|uniref:DNA damage-binding protein 1 n=1 Tax=Ambrosia artemisiifolia TaxID=4212 RepID=A0AAD5CZF1_AMBAR|nr:LOW QUALITY PROTEIN: hypothetical protein M8C21_020503 [Ambrosia artemisiifolia]